MKRILSALFAMVLAGCGADSSPDPIDPILPIIPPELPVPAAPSNLTALPSFTVDVDLAWTDNATDETGYQVERSADGVNFAQVASVGANVAAFGDSGLAASTSFSYRVRATGVNGPSAYSNVATVTTGAAALSWTGVTPGGTPPPGRFSHSAIYDSMNGRLLVYGGAWIGNSDVWALSIAAGGASTWSALTTTGTPPPYRYGHTAIYDETNHAMIVYGGNSGGTIVGDAWKLTLPSTGTPTWSEITPASLPRGSGRGGHVAVYDGPNQRMVIFGGDDENDDSFNDVWALSLPAAGPSTWTELLPTGTGPSPRFGSSGIYDAANARLVIWAGFENGGFTDTWTLNLNGAPSWTPMTTNTPPAWRYRQCDVYDAANQRMLVFGGNLGGASLDANNTNELWALSLPATGAGTWSLVTPSGTPPSARWGAAAEIVGSTMFVIGGYSATNQLLSDVWRFR